MSSSLFVEEGDVVEAGDKLAQLDGERLRLEMLSAKADLDRVRGEYGRYTDLAARGLVSEAMFEGLKYDLEALEASYELAQLNFEYSIIRAPIDGVVSAREIKLGQNVGINDVVFRITDTSELLAYLQIPQAELAKFAAGHSATLSVDAMPNTVYLASIERISPTIDARNGTFRATAFIDNRSGELAPGMFARFTIAYEKHTDALVIPKQALVAEDDQTAVYVVADWRSDDDASSKSESRPTRSSRFSSGLADDEAVRRRRAFRPARRQQGACQQHAEGQLRRVKRSAPCREWASRTRRHQGRYK